MDMGSEGLNAVGNYRALVAGATGLVGSELIRQLIADEQYGSVTAIARQERPEGIDDPAGKLTWIKANWEHLEREIDGLQVDVVFSALGTTIKKAGSREAFRQVDLVYPVKLADWAARNKVKQFHSISSIGAVEKSLFFYSRIKGEMEAALQASHIPSIHLYRPSLLLGNRTEHRRGEEWAAALSRRMGFLWRGPLSRYRPIHASEVARAVRKSAASAFGQQAEAVYIYESHQMIAMGAARSKGEGTTDAN
ncbi:NAD-dependent epimerase/dehydratase family protein [Paenibacillaceae bacterium]|nr:NAD-dependent epimerase/dehydratase family protein [Paenibacillaceae bacterium]